MPGQEDGTDHPQIKVIPVSFGEDGPDSPAPTDSGDAASSVPDAVGQGGTAPDVGGRAGAPKAGPAPAAEQAFEDPSALKAMSGTYGESDAGFGPARFSGRTRWIIAGVLFSLTMMVVLGGAMYAMGGGGMPVFGRVPPGALTGEPGTGEPGTAVPAVPGAPGQTVPGQTAPGQTAPGEAPANVAPGAGIGAYPALAQEAACRANLRSAATAIEVYYAEQGAYPSSLADVAQYAQSPLQCPKNKAAYGYDPNTHGVTCPNGHTLQE